MTTVITIAKDGTWTIRNGEPTLTPPVGTPTSFIGLGPNYLDAYDFFLHRCPAEMHPDVAERHASYLAMETIRYLEQRGSPPSK